MTARTFKWPCQITGRTTGMNRKPRRINAKIEGGGDVKAAMLAYMRRRRLAWEWLAWEWLGVEITAVTPLGQRVHITYEGEQQ